jgi:exodeoxyribonuclease VII small subunit
MSPDPASEPTFEHRLAELAEITAALEQGALGLDESLTRFERGVGLLRQCREMLDHAERRVEMLVGFDAEGNPVTRPFDAAATFEAPATAGKPSEAKPVRKRAPRKGAPDSSEPPDTSDADDKSGPSLF